MVTGVEAVPNSRTVTYQLQSNLISFAATYVSTKFIEGNEVEFLHIPIPCRAPSFGRIEFKANQVRLSLFNTKRAEPSVRVKEVFLF